MIRFIRPSIPPPESWIPFLDETYRAGHFTNFGPLHMRFEDELTEKYCQNGRRAVLASSATMALAASLVALGVRGNVLLPSFTFPATLQAVRQAGCQPVVLDVEERTWELSPDLVSEELEGLEANTVVPVRAFGLCRDLEAWSDVSRRHDMPVVIDAAAALGGRLQDGAPVGNQGTLEVFSMHATKVFGVGEGGVAFVPEELEPSFRRAVNFGLPAGESLPRGFNGKQSEFHCAVGLAMLRRIDRDVARRNEIARTYIERLSSFEELRFAQEAGSPPWQAFPVLLPGRLQSTVLVEVAGEEGLELRGYYRPALHTVATTPRSAGCPSSDYLSEHVVCLPMYSDMTPEEVEAVMRRTEVALTRSL